MMDDLISRRAAIDAVRAYATIWMEYTHDMTTDEIAQEALNSAKATMIQICEELPSAQPEHSEGLYVDGYNDGYRDGMKDAQPERNKGNMRGEQDDVSR